MAASSRCDALHRRRPPTPDAVSFDESFPDRPLCERRFGQRINGECASCVELLLGLRGWPPQPALKTSGAGMPSSLSASARRSISTPAWRTPSMLPVQRCGPPDVIGQPAGHGCSFFSSPWTQRHQGSMRHYAMEPSRDKADIARLSRRAPDRVVALTMMSSSGWP